LLRHYPYRGWLLICLLLLAATWVQHYRNRQQTTPERLAQTISADLQNRLAAWHHLRSDTALTDRMFARQLTDADVKKLLAQPFGIHAYKGGKLVFWNDNTLLPACDSADDHFVVTDKNIVFTLCDTFFAGKRALAVTIPVAWNYPFENEHLRSHWVASPLIPPGTEVAREARAGFLPVYYAPGKTAFHIRFNPADLRAPQPDGLTICLFVLTVLTGCFWLELVALYQARHRSPAAGLSVLLVAIASGHILFYLTGAPFDLQELKLFSPQLYASSRLLPSLGHLLITMLLLAWICIFIFTQVPYKTFTRRITAPPLRYLTAMGVSLLMAGYTFYSVHVIRSVVIDSMISFDVSNFYAINIYTVIGLLVIVLAASVSAFVLHILYSQFAHLIPRQGWLKYVFILLAGLACIRLNPGAEQHLFYVALLLWLLLITVMLGLKWLTVSRDLLAPRMIFWAVFICISATALVQYFNNEKERETRKLFAAKLLLQQDPMTQYLFLDIARELQTDPQIRAFMAHPRPEVRHKLNDRIEVLYLKGHLSKYQSDIYFFDTTGHGLFNEGRARFAELQQRVATAVPVADSFLYFSENAQDDHNYLARIPIPGAGRQEPAGFIFIDLALKKANSEAVYPELLRPGNIGSGNRMEDYVYAIYSNGRLVTQNGDYPFSLLLPDHLRGANYKFFREGRMSGLWYPAENRKSVIIIHRADPRIALITIFSYLFGIQLLLILATVIFKICFNLLIISSRSFRLGYLTFRRRIHYAMLGVVLISFLVIGIATTSFFNNRYGESNRNRLQTVTQTVEHAIRQYLFTNDYSQPHFSLEEELQQPEFRYFIVGLANQHRININIFDTAGRLVTASQTTIYDKGLLAPIMRADAFHALRIRQVSLLLQNERIGTLTYLSGYMPLQDNVGNTLGYINVPYFASQEELNYQISNILVALINLYAFIFLISSLLAVVITNSLTRSLQMIISRFKRLNLQQNELLEWPYDDEIGLLVKEYNKMVQKVETHALMLAQSERESAWREMARQVAHEIKNPLTPMKLNIQHLQQALKLNNPNIRDLTARISDSLVEQIDNLSYIASEFSNFAKMPEARPEELELNEAVERIAELYINKSEVSVTFVRWREPLKVMMDKSQLLRVCTNLLQNAMQAIPQDRNGWVEITLGRERQNAILSFRDNGTGIPASIRNVIFKPYFTTKSSGTGLGLAMTKKIIEFWKGNIWFETEEGRGTTFFIRLPLWDPAEETKSAKLPPTEHSEHSPNQG
jgi:two-component system nitrogen regulation sensor histidine kinase NtrY